MDRWPVKVAVDLDKEKVAIGKPTDTTISQLLSLRIHEVPYPYNRRIEREELTVYRLKAKLIRIKQEADSDLHLVLADPDKPELTLIVEIPAPECSEGSRFSKEIAASRKTAIELKTGDILVVTGVGFWDFIHQQKQKGAAENGFELHPVIAIEKIANQRERGTPAPTQGK